MSFLDAAQRLAREGFYVFPLVGGSKFPHIDGWQNRATRKPEQISHWWTDPVTGWEQALNVGICTTHYGNDHALLVVDVDNKNGKCGDDEILKLELTGAYFPATYTQYTPTGGKHYVYWTENPVKNSVGELAPGLDIRSRGGYIVASGSATEKGAYTDNGAQVMRAPDWLVHKCGLYTDGVHAQNVYDHARIEHVDPERAMRRAVKFLGTASFPPEGARNTAMFKNAAVLKDLGLDRSNTGLLLMEWNDNLPAPLDLAELEQVVNSAFKYGQNPIGSAAPESKFQPVETPDENKAQPVAGRPFDELNKEYAFTVAGGGHHILWETTDSKGGYKLEHLAEPSFHRMHAAKMMAVGEKIEPITKLWMNSPQRRSYKGICFMPGQTAPKEWYNLWRGFSIDPADKAQVSAEAIKAVELWFEHAKENVCRGDPALFHWLICYFAHLVQKPWEKPHVALVLRGGKGVGKNALIEMGPGRLLGSHSLVAAHSRYLVGNFNSHLENRLMLVLDEAFWSGDKLADGILKDLITGAKHVIEHKGKEPYEVDNKCRVIILGNEDWLVPASSDERRYAVFHVGEGRKQDRDFFSAIYRGMESGGDKLLLRCLLDYDISTFDPHEAPVTEALMDQKYNTLEPLLQWWFDCLSEGWLIGSDFGGEWPKEMDKTRFRAAFIRYAKERNIKGPRIPNERQTGRLLKKAAPGIIPGRRRDGGALINTYKIAALKTARTDWANHIGGEVEWETE